MPPFTDCLHESMGVPEASTDDEVDVPLLLHDPRAALFPMLTKVRGWEEVSTLNVEHIVNVKRVCPALSGTKGVLDTALPHNVCPAGAHADVEVQLPCCRRCWTTSRCRSCRVR